jgi:two-component system cell cycle response regulator
VSDPTPSPARSLVGESLRTTYREGLPARIGTLQQALEDLGEGNPGAEETLRGVAHILRGSGASYGYPEITNRAAALEEASPDGLREACEALLGELRAVAGATDSGQPVVLVIEEDPEIRHLLTVVLAGEGREVVSVGDASSVSALLDAHPVRLVVLDLLLSGDDGRDLLRRVREHALTAHAPVIVLGAHGSPKVQAECFALGADAFFQKPFDPVVLSSAVSAHLARALEHESESGRDMLTGLLNRSGLRNAYAKIDVDRERVLGVVEIDGFDRIESRQGGGTAEGALQAVGRVVGDIMADARGWAGRWEGETFVLVLPEPAASVIPLLEDVIGRVRQLSLAGADGETFRVTASAGFGAGTGAMSLDDLMDAGRAGMYHAREEGGNRVGGQSAAEKGRRKILIAEDDDLTASLLTHRLGRAGFEVEWHANGEDAYDAALQGQPDLVILDVRMPGMDGFELLERLRKVSVLHEVPIVMLTSQGAEADLVRGFRLGADDYVLKPFSPAEVVARVRRLLSQRP